jgi:ribosome biogenesis GTPase A
MLRIAKSLFDRNLVPNALSVQQDQLLAFVRRAQELATVVGDPSLGREIDQISASAVKPFLFVIVGEVKSGKSSLVNALLEAPVCAVDSAPCTTRVREINYGDEEQLIEVSEFEERLHLPHAILRHITVVDTPGTNSIIREHQSITENYIPQSDLVLFVFFAKNPYTGSAWDFLRCIKQDWQRNTLFVLQQADLLPPDERQRTVEHIREQLIAEGIEDPVVFAVSVKTGSGIKALREHLRVEVVEGGQFTKVLSLTENLLHFVVGVTKLLENYEKLNQHDGILLGKLHGLILSTQSDAEVEKQVARTMQTCRQLTDKANRRLRTRFQGGHSFLDKLDTFRNALGSGQEVRQWLTDFFAQVQTELSHAVYQDQVRYFSELHRESQELGQQMLEVLESRPRYHKKSASDALARRREQTLSEVRQRLDTLAEVHVEEIAQPRLALGRLLLVYRLAQAGVALGVLVLGLYFGDLLDAVILAAVGYLGVGYVLFSRNRERLEKRCSTALSQGLNNLERRLRTDIGEQLAALKAVGDGALALFERDVSDRQKQTETLVRSARELHDEIERVRAESLPAKAAGRAQRDGDQ